MSNVAKLKKKAADFEQKKQFDKALAIYVQVLQELEGEEEEGDVALYNRVGDLMLRHGSVSEAVDYYEKAVDLYSEGGFFNNAIALCNKILRQSPGRSSIYYKLGKISAKKGFKSDAKQNFLEYADRMQKAGNMDEAFRALKEFADLCPDQDDIRLMLADQLSKRDRKGEALHQLQTLYEKFEAEGRTAEARATVDRMKAIDPAVEPRREGPQATQKANDLVFLDVTFDEHPRRMTPRASPTVPPRAKPEAAPAAKFAPPVVALPPDIPLLDVDAPELADDEAQDGPPPERVAFQRADDMMLDTGEVDDIQVGGRGNGASPDAEPLPGLEHTSLGGGFSGLDDEARSEELAPAYPRHASASSRTADADTAVDIADDPAGDIADDTAGDTARDTARDTAEYIADDNAGGTARDFTDDTAEDFAEAPRTARLDFILPDEGIPLDDVPDSGLADLPFLIDDAPEPGRSAGALELEDPRFGSIDFGGDLVPPLDFGDDLGGPLGGGFSDDLSADLPMLDVESDGTDVPTYAPPLVEDDQAPEPRVPEPARAELPDRYVEPEPEPEDDSSILTPETRVEAVRMRLARAGSDWGLHREYGEALLEAGEREAGLAELESALIGFEREGDLDNARSVAEEIIRVNPNSVRHHQKRVEYAFRVGDKSLLAQAYLELADSLFRSGQAEKSRAVYQRVLDLAPDDIRAQAALSAFVEPLPPARKEKTRESTATSRRYTAEMKRASLPEPAPPPAVEAFGDDADFVNLGDWLRDDHAPKSTRMVVQEQAPSGDEQADFADMLRAFKQGVAENVEDEDHQSHYDLGIAYKEMGLVDEAISEFQRALRGTDNRARTYEALGQCFLEKGQYQVASTILARAAAEPGTPDDQLVGVLYLLGYAYEALQRYDDALASYQRVFGVDIEFRDVGERIAALERVVQ